MLCSDSRVLSKKHLMRAVHGYKSRDLDQKSADITCLSSWFFATKIKKTADSQRDILKYRKQLDLMSLWLNSYI